MNRAVGLALFTSAVLIAGSPGIRPRSGAADYPAHASIGPAASGAAVIPAAEVKKIFAVDIEKAGYVVIEVGVFAAGGRELDLSPLDFTLGTDPNAISERTVQLGRHRRRCCKAGPGRQLRIALRRSFRHGRSLGTTCLVSGSGYGPEDGRHDRRCRFGRRRGRQTALPLIVRLRAAVASNNSSGRRRFRMARRLCRLAGYLHFPKPSKKARGAAWVLEWQNTGERVNITLPK